MKRLLQHVVLAILLAAASADARVLEPDRKLSPLAFDGNVRQFGRSVLIDDDGGTYIGAVQEVVGTPDLALPPTGVVWADYTGNFLPWVISSQDQQAYLDGRTESFGAELALSSEGLVVSHYNGPGDGEVWIVPLDRFSPRRELVPRGLFGVEFEKPDGFGYSISALPEYETVAVGAPFDSNRAFQGGSVHTFDASSGSVMIEESSISGQWFGRSVAVSSEFSVYASVQQAFFGDGLVPAPVVSSVQFSFTVSSLSPPATTFSFDAELALAARSGLIAAGSAIDGLVVLASINGAQPLHVWSAAEGEGAFGRNVAIDDQYVLVSTKRLNQPRGSSGTVYVYDIATGLEVAELAAPTQDCDDCQSFGDALSISDGVALIGAPGVDNGIGAAYLVDLNDLHLPGDFNGDRRIDNADLNLLLGHWGDAADSVAAEWDGRPPAGDTIDNDELGELLYAWGAGTDAPTASVPEPAAVALALMASIVCRRRTCRR